MCEFVNYVAPYVSDFAEETLLVSDAMGYITNPDFVIDREYFKNNLVMYVLKGCLIVEQQNRRFQLTAENGILMNLRYPHKYYFSKNEETEILWFHFRGTPCEAMIHKFQMMGQMPLCFRDASFADSFLRLNQTATARKIPDEFLLSREIYSIVLSICRPFWEERREQSEDFSDKAARYAAENVDEKIDIEAFAAYMNMSKYHFCRKFRQAFSCTPLAYLQQKKIDKARKLLIYTDMEIAEIACQLSFYDQSHFSRVFQKETGITPGKFRRESYRSERENMFL